MAALEIADEASDQTARLAELETETASLREQIDAAQRRETAIEARLSRALDDAATRLERLARQLAGDKDETDGPA